MKRQIVLVAVLCGGCLPSVAQTPASTTQKAVAKPLTQPVQTAPAAARSAATDDGERKFRENCSRCHNAPEELPTRITGTVVMHMRVRASLGAADARAILRYLAP